MDADLHERIGRLCVHASASIPECSPWTARWSLLSLPQSNRKLPDSDLFRIMRRLDLIDPQRQMGGSPEELASSPSLNLGRLTA